MKKLIIFLVRLKLGLKKYEYFQFANQASDTDRYYFTDSALVKEVFNFYQARYHHARLANVSLNWLLSDECEILKVVDK